MQTENIQNSQSISTLSKIDFDKYFERLYYENIDGLFRFAKFRVKSLEMATDLVQDTFIKYLKYLDGIRGRNKENSVEVDASVNIVLNHRAMLYRILRNSIIDQYRKKDSYSLDDLLDSGYDPSSDESVENISDIKLSFERVIKILKELKPEAQELVYMRYIQGLSLTEISEVVGEKENNISVRIHRTLEKIKENI